MFNPRKYVNGSFVPLKENSVEDLSQREEKMPKKLNVIIHNFADSCCKKENTHHDRSYQCLLRLLQNVSHVRCAKWTHCVPLETMHVIISMIQWLVGMRPLKF